MEENKKNTLKTNRSLVSMSYRLGMPQTNTQKNTPLSGVNGMTTYLELYGGVSQQERMIKDKRRSLDKAVMYSYQGAFVKNLKEEKPKAIRALINPDRVKQDYDDKIISVGYEFDYSPGDIFEWCNTNSYWLIYLQDKTELAYFRGEIRRCKYNIKWEDADGAIHSVYAAVRGPVETKINYIQKNGISVDTPNHSLNILMPKNDATIAYFTRYNKFYLNPTDSKTAAICWRVEAFDTVSMEGVLEITAVEYYSNTFEDDIEKGVVGGLIIDPINPNSAEVETMIVGETFIKPKKTYEFSFNGTLIAEWIIDKKYPVVWKQIDDYTIQLQWKTTYSGQFTIGYGDYTKTVVVESLF